MMNGGYRDVRFNELLDDGHLLEDTLRESFSFAIEGAKTVTIYIYVSEFDCRHSHFRPC